MFVYRQVRTCIVQVSQRKKKEKYGVEQWMLRQVLTHEYFLAGSASNGIHRWAVKVIR